MHQRKRTILFIALALILTGGTITASAQADQYDVIEQEMEHIRGLNLNEPLDIRIVTRDELREDLNSEGDESSAEDIERNGRILVAFGLIDEGTDPGALTSDLYGEQIAGYYDPSTKQMVIVSDDEGRDLTASAKVTLAHETVHALQDQNFDLESLLDESLDGTDDVYLAVRALPEGDASSAEGEYLRSNPEVLRALIDEYEDLPESTQLDAAPVIFQETLLFPYVQGQEFVDALIAEGGWDSVNAAYSNPPRSTEQILHPEKYLAGEEPIAVIVPDPTVSLGGDWTIFDDNSMGEFQIGVILGDEYGVGSDQASEAASGWGGDTYLALGTDDEIAITWRSVWDSDDDASDFAQALINRETTRLDADAQSLDDEDGALIEGDGVVIRIVVDGEEVTYVQAPDLETLDLLATAN